MRERERDFLLKKIIEVAVHVKGMRRVPGNRQTLTGLPLLALRAAPSWRPIHEEICVGVCSILICSYAYTYVHDLCTTGVNKIRLWGLPELRYMS